MKIRNWRELWIHVQSALLLWLYLLLLLSPVISDECKCRCEVQGEKKRHSLPSELIGRCGFCRVMLYLHFIANENFHARDFCRKNGAAQLSYKNPIHLGDSWDKYITWSLTGDENDVTWEFDWKTSDQAGWGEFYEQWSMHFSLEMLLQDRMQKVKKAFHFFSSVKKMKCFLHYISLSSYFTYISLSLFSSKNWNLIFMIPLQDASFATCRKPHSF